LQPPDKAEFQCLDRGGKVSLVAAHLAAGERVRA
jgi:hypothetical protein